MNKIIFIVLTIIFISCNNHSNNTDKNNSNENTPQKKIMDSAKLVFDDVEFNMTLDELKKTNVFKSQILDFSDLFKTSNGVRTENDELTFSTWYSYTLDEKLKNKKIFDTDNTNLDSDVESKLLNYISEHFKNGGRNYIIGNKEFKIGYYLFDNK